MDIELSKRGLMTMFFRRRAVFLSIFTGVVLCAAAYIVFATPLYSASGSLLVKFGPNATPDVSRMSDEINRTPAPEQDHASALDSNVELIKSRSILRDVVNAFGVETLYPGLTAKVVGEDSPLEAAVTQIIRKDLVVKVEQQSDLITLTYMNRDPHLAAQFLQRLMDTFIERRADFYKKPPTEFLAGQIKDASAKLAASQQKLEDFKEKNGLSSLGDELQGLLKEKADIQTDALSSIDDARTKVEDLKLKESELLNTYRPTSPVIADLRQNIHVAEGQLRARQDDLNASTTSSNNASASASGSVTTQIAAINKRIGEIEAQRGTYDDLSRQVQIDEDNYKSYMEHGEQARINESLDKDKLTSISIVDSPTVPQKPSSPKKVLFLLIGLLGGFLLAAWSVILLERFDDRFSTPEQVSARLGIPVFASFTDPPRIKKA